MPSPFRVVRPALPWWLCLTFLLFSVLAHADDSDAPRAESPYFFVNSDDPATDRLPLKGTEVDVRIAGVIAEVTVTQHYRNEGKRPLEARYVFPGSNQAAVHAMEVRLGKRRLTATIKEKEEARQDYEQARAEGKTAALLEQQRPNVFQINVANILPGDDVAVELKYTELLVPTDGRYEFVFPTVVGPRYNSPKGEAAAEKWVSIPYLKAGEKPVSAFRMTLNLDSPVPVREIRSPSHAIAVQGLDTRHAGVELDNADRQPNNRDFILRYRLAGDAIQTGLMTYRGGDENFFLALVEPPKAIPADRINPRDYIFVLDVSGSMWGYPLDTAKTLMRNLLGSLRPTDTFNVMLFSGGSSMLSPRSVPATPENIERALAVINAEQGGGATEIVPALQRIVALPKAPEVSRSVIVVTDGYVAVENEVFRFIRQSLQQANVFAFGIGSSVNRALIEGMARAGQGEPFIVTKPEEAAEQAERLRKMISSPVLTRVKARFEGLEAYDLEPQVLPDLLGGRPLMLIGKWKGKAGGRLILDGLTAQGPWHAEVPVPADDAENPSALRHLWARYRIAALSDEETLNGGEEAKQAITALGLKYSLLTAHTSFVAVDQVIRNPDAADSDTVDQPSPLPEGVSNPAVGSAVPSTPEPGVWAALLLVAGWLGLMAWRRHGGSLT